MVYSLFLNFKFSTSILKRFVFLAAAFVSGVLEEFHKGQTHGVNHCTEYIHKDIDGMAR